MKENRAAALQESFGIEGGYAERDTEGGGAVNHGVTFTTFKSWRALRGDLDVTFADLKALTVEEAVEIYSAHYLDQICFDRLPIGVDYSVLDCSIIGGPTGGITIFQEALGFRGKNVDGHIGLSTLWAAKNRDTATLINKIAAARLAKYPHFKNWKRTLPNRPDRTWGQVWTDRIERVRVKSLRMAGSA